MKHYSNEEFSKADKGFFKAETLRQLKRIGRKRERAALKRMVASEVAEDAATPDEVSYWKRKFFGEMVEDSRWADEALEWVDDENLAFVEDAVKAADHKAERMFDEWMDARHELAA